MSEPAISPERRQQMGLISGQQEFSSLEAQIAELKEALIVLMDAYYWLYSAELKEALIVLMDAYYWLYSLGPAALAENPAWKQAQAALRVAATVIQWLGSDAGQGFLRKVAEEIERRG